MKRFNFRAGALALVVALLVGCASLGVPEPRDFHDRASLAYDIAGGGATMVADLNAAGELTKEEANAALDKLEDYKSGIDVAIAVWSINQADGEKRLVEIRAALRDTIEELEARRAGDVE